MSSFRHTPPAEPASVTQPGGGGGGGGNGDVTDRRYSESASIGATEPAAVAPSYDADATEMAVPAPPAKLGAVNWPPEPAGSINSDPAATDAAKVAALNQGHPPPVIAGKPRYSKDVNKQGWSRGRKICCGLTLLFLAILITIGVLIAFLVRVPSVEYERVELLCENNDYLRCAQNYVNIHVLLLVNNPNIIGATINAELALYKMDGTFLGPGSIDDVDIAKRGTTEVMAKFNITSNRAYDIVQALYVPPTHDVDVRVDGTIYVHVGLLRPSMSFEQTVTIPKQDGLALLGSLLPDAGEVAQDGIETGIDAGIDAIPDDIGSTIVGQIPGVPDSIADAVPQLNQQRDAIPKKRERPTRPQRINPKKFAKALVEVGPPGSATRRDFVRRHPPSTVQRQQSRASPPPRRSLKRLATRLHMFTLDHIRQSKRR